MSKFTREAVIDAAREIVAEKGEDYVYPDYHIGCSYSDEGNAPSCIVGYIVNRIDPELFQKIADMESDGDPRQEHEARVSMSFAANELNDLFAAGIDDTILEDLRRAQMAQDSGETWGVALHRLGA